MQVAVNSGVKSPKNSDLTRCDAFLALILIPNRPPIECYIDLKGDS